MSLLKQLCVVNLGSILQLMGESQELLILWDFRFSPW